MSKLQLSSGYFVLQKFYNYSFNISLSERLIPNGAKKFIIFSNACMLVFRSFFTVLLYPADASKHEFRFLCILVTFQEILSGSTYIYKTYLPYPIVL